MKAFVLKQEGKSISKTDFVTLLTFETKEEAEKYCEENTNLEEKYWTYCDIIFPNVREELFYNDGHQY